MPIAQHSRKNTRENGVIAYGLDQKYLENRETQANREKNGGLDLERARRLFLLRKLTYTILRRKIKNGGICQA
jgi:hypothetical protein